MHELSITQSILSIALEKANVVQAKRVTKINLTIGELSGIVDECVQFCFDFLSKDTIAAEASLCFHQPPTQLQCCQHSIRVPILFLFFALGNWGKPSQDY